MANNDVKLGGKQNLHAKLKTNVHLTYTCTLMWEKLKEQSSKL